jgi:hypothetical protein
VCACGGAAVTIKGNTTVGLSLLVTTVHPMKLGGTLMSSLLFNTALVLLATNADIQFCAQAFALYSSQAAIQAIWGDQVPWLALSQPVARAAFMMDNTLDCVI